MSPVYFDGFSPAIGRVVTRVERVNAFEVVVSFEDGSRLVGHPMGNDEATTIVEDVIGTFKVGRHYSMLEKIETAYYAKGEYDDGQAIDHFVVVLRLGCYNVAILCKCVHDGFTGGSLGWRFFPRAVAPNIHMNEEGEEAA